MGAQFKLQPNPTYWLTVAIPVAGEEDAALTIECKRWTRQQIIDIPERYAGKLDADIVLDNVVGWRSVDAEFSPEALGQLLERYPHAATRILTAMVDEQGEAKRKN